MMIERRYSRESHEIFMQKLRADYMKAPGCANAHNEGMRPASKEVPENTGKYRNIVDENGAVHGRIPVQ